ncbi:hypothetical protein COLO4_16025 [Corchorus olitorius]|uniref:Uncharacterized protein n=1 Tax=Corchorus olitorius TaxID=93759 RepID=A0A1R3JKC8_9ROSI|nr:hypothetical protein COLO4_16025 [Corchorus olitorius]
MAAGSGDHRRVKRWWRDRGAGKRQWRRGKGWR